MTEGAGASKAARDHVTSLGRAISVEGYRATLARRLQNADVGPDAATRAELIFNLIRVHSRMSQDFEILHRRRGWTWAGFRIMNVLWRWTPSNCATSPDFPAARGQRFPVP